MLLFAVAMTDHRRSSSAQFAAVTAAVGDVYNHMLKRLKDQRSRGQVDLSEEQIDTIARIARGMAYDSTVDAYKQGWANGRTLARIELGEPSDVPSTGVVVGGLVCPTCKRPVD